MTNIVIEQLWLIILVGPAKPILPQPSISANVMLLKSLEHYRAHGIRKKKKKRMRKFSLGKISLPHTLIWECVVYAIYGQFDSLAFKNWHPTTAQRPYWAGPSLSIIHSSPHPSILYIHAHPLAFIAPSTWTTVRNRFKCTHTGRKRPQIYLRTRLVLWFSSR